MSLCMDTLNLPDCIQIPPLPFVTWALNLSEPICLMSKRVTQVATPFKHCEDVTSQRVWDALPPTHRARWSLLFSHP